IIENEINSARLAGNHGLAGSLERELAAANASGGHRADGPHGGVLVLIFFLIILGFNATTSKWPVEMKLTFAALGGLLGAGFSVWFLRHEPLRAMLSRMVAHAVIGAIFLFLSLYSIVAGVVYGLPIYFLWNWWRKKQLRKTRNTGKSLAQILHFDQPGQDFSFIALGLGLLAAASAVHRMLTLSFYDSIYMWLLSGFILASSVIRQLRTWGIGCGLLLLLFAFGFPLLIILLNSFNTK
ncbi:MAG: hypothetical protein ACK6D7_04625, partial [Acidobacteriota bacterium]